MTDTRTTTSSPLAVPALVVGVLALLSLVLIRVPFQAAPAVLLGITAAVLGHLALRNSAGTRRKLALGGIIGGYAAIGSAVIAIVAIAIR